MPLGINLHPCEYDHRRKPQDYLQEYTRLPLPVGAKARVVSTVVVHSHTHVCRKPWWWGLRTNIIERIGDGRFSGHHGLLINIWQFPQAGLHDAHPDESHPHSTTMSYHDTDLIAYLYAYDGSRVVTEMIRHCLDESGQAHLEEEPYHRGSRESTAAPESPSEPPPMRLELRFSSGPRTRAGFVFGAAKSCDFVLRRNAISNVHFAITFDECDRLIVRDLGSRNGTTVEYDGHGGKNRVGFQWIIGGADEVQNRAITVRPRRDIALLVDVNPFRLDVAHAERVALFRQGTANPDELLAGFDLSRRRTAVVSTAQTPVPTWILLTIEELGAGGFGRVERMWDVSTGRYYARKTPLRRLGNGPGDKERLRRWRREIDNMHALDHVSTLRQLQ